ncbi:sigma-70 family RNA polymerase sigma factor [Clostridium sp.]|uniref:sigma-70 family RNA polymerase sigma factor n=1 Tax=Clostridium sp. TaxID=1506 RepID=UPI002844B962|nr:sigma-70 family RNA polymerase sigma factor [Clostridium sp.]MDR3593419.1 sigma-70 family RNA polymerase sigma factor [Clostridium sp.]
MDYGHIEDLVSSSRIGDEKSKELLVNEFKPFIISLSKKTFINGYDKYDIQSECYKILFYCLERYDSKTHKFVAYAINAIKNQLSSLIKKSINRSNSEGNEALSLYENLENTLFSNEPNLEDSFCQKCDKENLNKILSNLSDDEKELINYIFFKNNTVRTYAFSKNMCYSTAILRKNNVLKKIGVLL